MRVRFGFVAMSSLRTDLSPSRTMNLSTFRRLPNRQEALQRLTHIAGGNLESTAALLRHAAEHGIELYRFSSRLIPLLGHPDTEERDFFRYLDRDFRVLGQIVRAHGMRVSFHPDHFVVLSSPLEAVQDTSLRTLGFHLRMIDAMELGGRVRLVVHVGGAYGDRSAALGRFAANVMRLPPRIRTALAVENDDRSFTAAEVLAGAADLGLPVVIDTLHHRCNGGAKEPLGGLLQQAFRTWPEGEPPKVHLSSPRDEANPRAHADFISLADGLDLLEAARPLGQDFDVMIEAKEKDRALLRLCEELGRQPGVARLGGGTILYRP